jgi:probable phosphoglycerate mutase
MGGVMLSRDRLILVRHGESTWNAEERLQGQLDPPLSERGREQSLALVGMLDGVPDERVVCSDLGRARQTAELLGLRPARFDSRWREIDVGSWGGRVAAEVDALGPELTNWRGGPRKAVDGESWDDFFARVAEAVDELVAAGGPWMVVCHGGCIRVAVAHVTGADPLSLGSPPNASATVFELGQRPRLLVYGSLPDGGLPTGLY